MGSYPAVGDRRGGTNYRPSLLAGVDPVLSGVDRYVRDTLAPRCKVRDAARALVISDRTPEWVASTALGSLPSATGSACAGPLVQRIPAPGGRAMA